MYYDAHLFSSFPSNTCFMLTWIPRTYSYRKQGYRKDSLKVYQVAISLICFSLVACVSGKGGPPDTTFIEDAVLELLKTRRILKCSYPYGFFLEPKSTKKEIYELMQVSVLLFVRKDKCSVPPWDIREVGLKLFTFITSLSVPAPSTHPSF